MKKKLGEILVTSGAVKSGDIEAALSDQRAGEPSRLGDLLVATGKLSSVQLARGLALQYDLPYVEVPPLPQAVLDLVPLELQRQFRFVPMKSEGTELSIAMADLANIEVLAILEQQWTKVHVHVAGGDEIDALHNTLSGLFAAPREGGNGEGVAAESTDDLFAAFDVDPVLEQDSTTLSSMPSPVPSVPVIAPVQLTDGHPRPGERGASQGSAPPRAEDLFGDLNLESAPTGIDARPPEELLSEPPSIPSAPVPEVFAEGSGPVFSEGSGPVASESGPVLLGIREGTGPMLDMLMLADTGTGPLVDTPFFGDPSSGSLVPPLSDAPFPSSPSSLSALAIAAPLPTATMPVSPAAAVFEAASAPSEGLPDWLRGEAPAPGPAAPPATGAWTGAFDHLMPSKLVVGLTRALIARGLVTEEEILAALGQKK